jgi:hypothetical protein
MKTRIFLSAILVAGLAAAASAQTGKSMQYSNAPTDTDYRMRIVEPKNGATLTGKDVNIVVNLPSVPPGNKSQSTASDLKQKDMITPILQVWTDGKSQGNLPGGQNVFYARDLLWPAQDRRDGQERLRRGGGPSGSGHHDRVRGRLDDVGADGDHDRGSRARAAACAARAARRYSRAAAGSRSPVGPPPAHRDRAPLAVMAGLLLLGAGIALRFRS